MVEDRVQKPWGWYQVLHRSPNSVTKLIHVNSGHQTSLQSHKNRYEYWFPLTSNVECNVGYATHFPEPGGTPVVVLPHAKHRLGTREESSTDIEIMEVQLGNCSEDDIVRYEDNYGRVTS